MILAGVQVLTVVLLKTEVFWDVTLCCLVWGGVGFLLCLHPELLEPEDKQIIIL